MRYGVLECCTDSLESVKNAVRGGANRLELCGNLVIGGTTPSFALFEQVKEICDTRINVLIRPRFGDFCYTKEEMKQMAREIRWFREHGANGVVIGILNPDGTLNTEGMKYLLEEAGTIEVTLHRAFDMCRNPQEVLEQAVSFGIHNILTSGQQESAPKGAKLLKQLQQQADGRIQILAGGGIHAGVIRSLYEETGILDYHMSGKIVVNSKMQYRKSEVSMGLPSLSEYEIWQTAEDDVKEARKVLDELEKKAGEHLER